MKSFFRFFCLLCLCLALSGCSQEQLTPTPEPPNTEEATPVTDPTVTLQLLAVGDNLIHGPIYRGARQADGSYDFSSVYQEIAPIVQASDLAFVNQETPLGGVDLGLSSYPKFNSPQEVGDALYDLGFNLISIANNHVMDAGVEGLKRTIAFWQEKGISPAGVGNNVLIEKDGVKIALLAYTYGTNQGPLGQVDLIDRQKIASMVAKAKEEADIVLVSMHWGTEYQEPPDQQQQELAEYLASLGVDVVLGHHPHVVQPFTTLAKAGGGETLVFYSLGNLVSSQDKTATLIGGLAQVELIWNTETKTLSFGNVSFSPLITQYGPKYSNTRVIPWAAYTPELAATHGSPDKSFSYNSLQAKIQATFPSEATPNMP